MGIFASKRRNRPQNSSGSDPVTVQGREIPCKIFETIIEKTDCTKERAKKALEEANGDLAEAILSLS